ncbi:MAG: Do family serine endopeptidase [Stellaceae bacterium]
MTRFFNRLGHKRKTAFAAALLASTVLASGGLAWSQTDTPHTTPSREATAPKPLSAKRVYNQAGFAPLVKQVKAAVVNISTTDFVSNSSSESMPNLPQNSPFGDMFRHFFEHQQKVPERAMGSGFIINSAGYIVTNNHVIDHAHKITVTLDNGQIYQAKLVGHDKKTDLALLKINVGHPLPYVAWGNSNHEEVGDWVIAVGNPFGLGGTVTAGIVSAHGRNINEGPYDDFLQIDAPINPGNSGGPLFNQSGQVIGIDTAIYSPNGGSVGIGFAIPSNIASKVVAQLREHGKVERGWLGIEMQAMTPTLSKAIGLDKNQGVLIDKVMKDSPAKRAALKQGDVILAYNGKAIHNGRDLALAVAETTSGTTVPVEVWHNGHQHRVSVTIASQSAEQTASATTGTSQSGKVGMALASLSQQNRAELGLGPTASGVVVMHVVPGGKADQSGIQAGDLIVRIGHTAIHTPAEAAAKIHTAENQHKEAVPLLVTRNGTTYYLALELSQS